MWSPGVRDWHPLLISTSTRPDQQFPGQVQGSIAGITKGLAPPGSWKPVGKRLLHSCEIAMVRENPLLCCNEASILAAPF